MSANRDEALKCLIIARKALASGDYARAEKFASKAMSMHQSDEAESLLIKIAHAKTEGDERPSPSGQQDQDEQPHDASHSHANGHTSHQHSNHHSNHQNDRRSHEQQNGPTGMRSNLHQRPGKGTTSASHQPKTDEPDPGTPEQRKLIAQILAAKDLYHILSIEKTASDDDIRKAYRKLALKLHPDKCKAHKADEAFKAVGKAFACLSDADKRAYYDRTGYESSAAAAAESQRRHAGAAGRHHAYHQQEIDPEEIFNMFFGMGPGARVFTSQFGGHPFFTHQQRQRPRQQQRQEPASEGVRLMMGLMNFLPVLLLVLLGMFSASQKPAFSLVRDHHHYPEAMTTQRLEVPYFVKSKLELDRSFPKGSSNRFKLERQVEGDYYERLQQRCQAEKMARHRAWTYGQREKANQMSLASCVEIERINSKLGSYRSNTWAR